MPTEASRPPLAQGNSSACLLVWTQGIPLLTVGTGEKGLDGAPRSAGELL